MTGPADAIEAYAYISTEGTRPADEGVQLFRRADQVDLIAGRGADRLAFTFPLAWLEQAVARLTAPTAPAPALAVPDPVVAVIEPAPEPEPEPEEEVTALSAPRITKGRR